MSAARSTEDARRERRAKAAGAAPAHSSPSPSAPIDIPASPTGAQSRRFNGISAESVREIRQLKRAIDQANASPAAQPESFSVLSRTDIAICKACYDLTVKHKSNYGKVLEELPEAAILPLLNAARFQCSLLSGLLQDYVRSRAVAIGDSLSDRKNVNKYMDTYTKFVCGSVTEVTRLVVMNTEILKLAAALVKELGETTGEVEMSNARLVEQEEVGRRE
jgi:hypothetical protein